MVGATSNRNTFLPACRGKRPSTNHFCVSGYQLPVVWAMLLSLTTFPLIDNLPGREAAAA